MERKHVMVEGAPGKESTDAKEIQENASNDIKKALEIILGLEDEDTTQIQTMSINDTKEKTLIDRARELRAEFEAMKGEI